MAAMTVVVRGRVLFFCGPCIKKKDLKSIQCWCTLFKEALTTSRVREQRRGPRLLAGSFCQKRSLPWERAQTIPEVSLWRPPRWSPPVGPWWARGGSCSWAPRRGCTRRERTGPQTPSAWPPYTKPSPTSPSPPSDARFPAGDKTGKAWGERIQVKNKQTNKQKKKHCWIFFFMHNCEPRFDDCNNTMVRLSGPVSQTITRLRTNNETHFCISNKVKEVLIDWHLLYREVCGQNLWD